MISASSYGTTSSYGIYGTVKYPGNGVVVSPIVTIYKQKNGQYTYYGQTTASACGYYTFDTGGTGNFRVVVSGQYSLRYAPCGTVFATDPVAGDEFGYVSLWNPWLLLDIHTA